jgi:hypothetical protein
VQGLLAGVLSGASAGDGDQIVTPALLRDCERSKGRGRVGPVDKSPTLESNAGSSGAVPVDGKLQAAGSSTPVRYLPGLIGFSLGCLMVAWPRGPPGGGPHSCTVCRPQF